MYKKIIESNMILIYFFIYLNTYFKSIHQLFREKLIENRDSIYIILFKKAISCFLLIA